MVKWSLLLTGRKKIGLFFAPSDLAAANFPLAWGSWAWQTIPCTFGPIRHGGGRVTRFVRGVCAGRPRGARIATFLFLLNGCVWEATHVTFLFCVLVSVGGPSAPPPSAGWGGVGVWVG